MFRLAPATHAVLSLCVGLICCACSEERTETSRGATAQEAAGSEKTQAGAVAPDKPAAPKASAKESPDRDSAARGWRQSWQAFAQTLSRHVQAELEHKQLASQLEPVKAVGWSSEKVAKVFEGATVTWHGEVVGIHKTGGERKIYVVRMPPHPVRLKDEFTITLNSLRLLPEEANAKAWGPVKVGDRVRFRTVLKGEPAMPFLVNPRMVAFDERTERYLDVKRNWREGGPVIQVLHGLTNKSLAERGGSREDTLIMVNTGDAELLNRAAPGTRAPETREGEKAKQERIRVAALKKAAELGYKPVIMIRTPQGTIGLLPGSECTIVRGRFTLVDGNMVVNAREKPENVLGTVLKQGEYGHVKDGKCTKLPAILGRQDAATPGDPN